MAFGDNAAPKHYRFVQLVAANTWGAVIAAIPASRVLIISKITVANESASASQQFSLNISTGTPTDGAGDLIARFTIAVGEGFTETGIVILTGEQLWLNNLSNGTGAIAIQVFGEEVDAA